MRIAIVRLASLAGLAVVAGCGWVALMELWLRHDGYIWRALIASAIVVEGALTAAVCEDLFELARLRWPLTAAAAATVALGCGIIAEDLARPGLPARPHFEGYLLIIGLVLIAYGLLTIAVTRTGGSPRPRRAQGAPASRTSA